MICQLLLAHPSIKSGQRCKGNASSCWRSRNRATARSAACYNFINHLLHIDKGNTQRLRWVVRNEILGRIPFELRWKLEAELQDQLEQVD